MFFGTLAEFPLTSIPSQSFNSFENLSMLRNSLRSMEKISKMKGVSSKLGYLLIQH